MKHRLFYISLIVVGLSLANPVAATLASQLGFTTGPLSVAPGLPSDIIAVQLQDANGQCQKADETVYLNFVSSSPTGEFHSSSGGDLDGYISKNTCNRNFTYKDATTGVFTVTVQARGKTWQSSQQITVGSGSAPSSIISTSPSTTNAGIWSVAETVARPQLLGGVKLHVPRQVNVHSPNYYWAETERFEAVPDMFWNFGDGTSAAGTGAWHSYEYVGRYVLSVRAPSAGAQAVARSVVEVTEPKIIIESAEQGVNGFVELGNPSPNDVDVTGYEIASGRRNFRIPEGTFVAGNGSAIIANRVSGLDVTGGRVALNSPDGTALTVFSVTNSQLPATGQGAVLGITSLDVSSLQKSLAQMRAMLISMKSQSEIAASPATLPALSSTATPVTQNTAKIVVARPKGLFGRFVSLFR